MALLETIDSPADLKGLSTDELRTLCAELRRYMIECCAENPGHLGSSLGAVEIAVALHKVFNTPQDGIVWDVGHQAYAHKILTGRRESFRNNRKLGGISGFPRRSESPYDAFGAGHSSTSISAALGLAVADKLRGGHNHYVAVIGDGALSGGLAFEGLNNAGVLKTDLLVILNDNQIAIDRNNGAMHEYLVRFTTSRRYNQLKTRIWESMGEGRSRYFIQRLVRRLKRLIFRDRQAFNLFDALGFRYFGPVDGNDIVGMTEILSRLKDIPGPKLLHAMTVKGKGYGPAEADQTTWHAPGRFDPQTGERAKGKGGADKYQVVFGQTVTELAEKDSRIIGITPAMASGCSIDIMMKAFPERTFDVGIAEQHALTFAAGLAAGGMIPFCNIYSSFSQRAFDSLVHDVALQGLKVILCLDRGGIVGEDGATHHGAFDMASYRPIPNLIIASPMNERELRNLLYSATGEEYGATVIRYPRGEGAGVPWRGEEFSSIPVGKARLLHEGRGIAVLSIGPVGGAAAEAVRRAADEGIEVLHYDMRFIKPLDSEALADACSRADHIITVEDGAITGGLHGAVAEYIADNGLGCKLTPLGIPDRFIEHGTPAQLYSECGFDAEAILRAIKDEKR
ncbi:MAG: 1-deoxy-D-xylulose-5-phosphate synthase [Bacteroidales bacterium]|nr:1-deoxy-D-xylulose-5-phosphate synthase [Bacteroidales bacterium]